MKILLKIEVQGKEIDYEVYRTIDVTKYYLGYKMSNYSAFGVNFLRLLNSEFLSATCDIEDAKKAASRQLKLPLEARKTGV